ncbi:MAG TPA: ATP-binding protein [Vicinamibacterales bacterium]|jgi:signal transduction histidine kinase/ActR/RegA family two-component response regulator|nr:ATP-binding protein [Vicinamibacterales bacterium]
MAEESFIRTSQHTIDGLSVSVGQAELQERLMTLAAASRSLLSSPSVEDVLPATLKLAEQMVPADGYAVWRRQDNIWRIDVSTGISEKFASAQVPDVEPSQIPFTEPIVVEDVEATPRLAARLNAYREEGIHSMIAIPMSIRGEASGSLTFYFRRPHVFSSVETQIALAVGNLASAALTTGELYDAQRRIRRQSDFLAEAAAVLAKSLDYHVTLKRVVDLAVPQIADWCAVDLVGEGGAVERLAVAHINPEKVEMARRIRDRFPERADSRYTPQYVINTGKPAMAERITEEGLARVARNPEHFEAIRELGLCSFMCVPLLARGRTFGAMTFVSGSSGRHYNASDLQFACDIASRAALAVDNARAYEEARRASQLKDEFLATLSHELRTPLNAILGYARMLRSGLLDGAKQARGIEILERNAASLTQIVEDVLDVSRIISGKLTLHTQPLDLASILAQGVATVQPAADAKGVRIHADIDPDAAQIMGDPDRLQQVIWNLLSNAVKFTPSGERIWVRLERASGQVEIAVIDTGVGISPAFLPHVFERFRQADSRISRQHGGLGLGLAISRHIVEMHGGTIEAHSDGPDKGSTFVVRLPSARRESDLSRRLEPRAANVGSAPNRPSLSGVRVLAVDDDDDSLEMLREILEAAGAEVRTAQNGEEAIDLLRNGRFGVLVSDLGMPGMDGFELIGRVRHLSVAEGGRTPAAALTAYARSEDRTRSLRSGFQMHLSKPIEPEELLISVKALSEWDESMF